MSVNDAEPVPAVVLLARPGAARERLREALAHAGVMLVRHRAGGYLVPDGKFREAARLVLRAAKRKYGSAYWYHPLIGKFQMSGGIPK